MDDTTEQTKITQSSFALKKLSSTHFVLKNQVFTENKTQLQESREFQVDPVTRCLSSTNFHHRFCNIPFREPIRLMLMMIRENAH